MFLDVKNTNCVSLSPSTLDLLDWARENDDLAARIAANGERFIREHLTNQIVTDYWHALLTAFASELQYSPEALPTLEEVPPQASAGQKQAKTAPRKQHKKLPQRTKPQPKEEL